MALGKRQEAELRAILRAFRVAHAPVAVPGGPGKALEAWLMLRIAYFAHNRTAWNVALCGGDGLPLAPGADFAMRTQPGKIAASDPVAVGFVALAPAPGCDPELALELHGGVQWAGRSAARHECDLSLLPATIGDAIRNHGGGYPRGLPLLAIECKDRVNSGPTDEMRETLARLFDLACIAQGWDGYPHRIFHQPSGIGWGRRFTAYRQFFQSGQFAIARAGGFQLGARQLGLHYGIARYPAIYGHTGHQSMRRLLARFDTLLGSISWLKN